MQKKYVVIICVMFMSLSDIFTSLASPRVGVGDFNVPLSTVSSNYAWHYEYAPREEREVSEAIKGYDSPNDEKIALICGGIITVDEFHNKAYGEIVSQLYKLKEINTKVVTVNVWQWDSPGSESLSKHTAQLRITIAKQVAEPLVRALQEAYSDPSKPVLSFAGSYEVRSKNNASSSVTASMHAYGAAIDFNTDNSTLVNSNGERLSNWNYGNRVFANYESWKSLPECQAKYNIFHENSPVVVAMKKYGFAWGGDWSDKYRDGMHFQWIDG